MANVKTSRETLSKKTLLELAAGLGAVDITNTEAAALPRNVSAVFVSRGVYGANAALLRDDNGGYYVIKMRNSNLFKLI